MDSERKMFSSIVIPTMKKALFSDLKIITSG
jgi:hypothetical protein